MRSTATILLLALLGLKAEAELRFTDPQAFPDIGLEMPTFFAASPDGVSMPHTESFLVTESDGSRRLEDRYDTFDLWSARTVRARWRDENGNLLVVARLASAPPDDPPETLSTRSDFESRLTALAIKPKDAAARNAAVVACAPVDVLEEPVRPRRSRRREIETLLYYQSTNQLASVWVFRPVVHKRGAKVDWYMAALVLSPDENPDSASARFDAYFLDRVRVLPDPSSSDASSPILNSQFSILNSSESTLLKRDYALSVVNYEGWRPSPTICRAFARHTPPQCLRHLSPRTSPPSGCSPSAGTIWRMWARAWNGPPPCGRPSIVSSCSTFGRLESTSF